MTKILNVTARYNTYPCNICREIPKCFPIFRCSTKQHTICLPCSLKLPRDGALHCTECNSSISKISNTDRNETRSVTVEELFRLPREKVNLLLSGSKEHLNIDNKEIMLKQWKPIKCPHGPCRKTINCSSLQVHFNYEHPSIDTFELARGNELYLQTDISMFEYGTTKCIGMIKLLSPLDDDNIQNNILFWVLVSTSAQVENSKSYVLYWITSHFDTDVQYTIEMFSPVTETSCATFCKVLDVKNNMSIPEIIKTSNCLFLTYGSVKSLVDQNDKLNVSITIH